MIPEFNLKAIKKGDTYVFPMEFYEDECEEVAIDVTNYYFTINAINSLGESVFIWEDVDFEIVAPNKRLLTLSHIVTASYPVGEFSYELQVQTDTLPEIYETWMQGFIKVNDQITLSV